MHSSHDGQASIWCAILGVVARATGGRKSSPYRPKRPGMAAGQRSVRVTPEALRIGMADAMAPGLTLDGSNPVRGHVTAQTRDVCASPGAPVLNVGHPLNDSGASLVLAPTSRSRAR